LYLNFYGDASPPSKTGGSSLNPSNLNPLNPTKISGFFNKQDFSDMITPETTVSYIGTYKIKSHTFNQFFFEIFKALIICFTFQTALALAGALFGGLAAVGVAVLSTSVTSLSNDQDDICNTVGLIAQLIH